MTIEEIERRAEQLDVVVDQVNLSLKILAICQVALQLKRT
jgi:hypothetical protein